MIESEKLLESEKIIFICDYCQNEYEVEVNSFSEALAEAKSTGWKMKKDGNDWLHFCCEECLYVFFHNKEKGKK